MKLDSETAERLSLDAALGQLAPDVLALWEAYLGDRPELAGAAELDARTVALARHAMAAQAQPSGGAKPLTVPRGLRYRAAGRWAVAAAAGLILGLAAGLYFAPNRGGQGAAPRGTSNQVPTVAAVHSRDTHVPPVTAAADAVQSNRFWSIDRLYRQVSQAERNESRTRTDSPGCVKWESPVKPTITGDAL